MKDRWHDLSDGSQVRILQVTFGLEHKIANEPEQFTSATTSLMFWMYRRSLRRNSRMFSVLDGWITDSQDQITQLFLRTNYPYGGYSSDPQLYVFELPSLPPEDQLFTLSITILDHSKGASSHSVEWLFLDSKEWSQELMDRKSIGEGYE